jgi:hypothetical protein
MLVDPFARHPAPLPRSPRPAADAGGPDAPVERCGYVTDGRRLLRIVAPIDLRAGIATAVVEDCATLRWRLYGFRELRRLALRPVVPGPERR